MKTTNITLAKALKLRKALAGRVALVENKIRVSNSYLAGTESFNSVKALKLQVELKNSLLELKDKIRSANDKIYQKIDELQECKATITFLRSIPTRNGKVADPFSYNGEGIAEREYVAQITQHELDGMVNQHEMRIQELQDEIDEFNAKSQLTISQRMLTITTEAFEKDWYIESKKK